MEDFERRQALLGLIRKHLCDDNAAKLSRQIEKDASYVNRLFYARNKSGGKAIGQELMDACRKTFDLALGFWDMTPEQAEKTLPKALSDETVALSHYVSEPPATYAVADRSVVTIPEYDTGGSMGAGLVLHDQPGVIQRFDVTREWVSKNVPYYTRLENLAVVTGFGDSMQSMFNPGDPLLVDTGIQRCDVDGVYFFRIDNDGFIKTLQRVPGKGIVVISENQRYENWTITPNMNFQVLAKVLIAWRGQRL